MGNGYDIEDFPSTEVAFTILDLLDEEWALLECYMKYNHPDEYLKARQAQDAADADGDRLDVSEARKRGFDLPVVIIDDIGVFKRVKEKMAEREGRPYIEPSMKCSPAYHERYMRIERGYLHRFMDAMDVEYCTRAEMDRVKDSKAEYAMLTDDTFGKDRMRVLMLGRVAREAHRDSWTMVRHDRVWLH